MSFNAAAFFGAGIPALVEGAASGYMGRKELESEREQLEYKRKIQEETRADYKSMMGLLTLAMNPNVDPAILQQRVNKVLGLSPEGVPPGVAAAAPPAPPGPWQTEMAQPPAQSFEALQHPVIRALGGQRANTPYREREWSKAR